MTSLLAPSAVALLAHKRLTDVVEALQRKVTGDVFDVGGGGVAGVAVNDTERRVLGLARAALNAFEAAPAALPTIDAPHRLQVGQGISRYAILGSAGFELPAYADVFAPGGAWTADAIRRGTPDPHLSRVLVGAPQLAVRVGELGLALAGSDDDRVRIRAFTSGMLAAVAHGVVVGPVLRGLQVRRTKREWNRHSPAVDIAAADSRILRELLGGGAASAMWQGWWPPTADVPDALFQGYVNALEEVYALSANRPPGFSDFEDGFSPGDPLTAVRLRNAYAFMRNDATAAAWTWGEWYGVLLPVLLMPPIALLIARALPHGQHFFSQANPVDERSVWEVLALSLGLGALPPFVYSMILWSQIDEHVDSFVNALVLGILRVGLGTASLATLGSDPSALVRWLLLFTPTIGTDVYAAIRAIMAKTSGRPGDAFVFFLNTLPAMTGVTTLLFAALMKLVGVDSELAYWLLWALFTALLLLAVGLPVSNALAHTGGIRSFFLRDKLPELPLLDALQALSAARDSSGLALLFDDSTLWSDPAVAAPTLADLRYPAGPRGLVRIWIDGDLHVSQDDRTVTFKRPDGSTLPVSLSPATPTAADLVQRLKSSVPGLEAEVVGEHDPLYDLPFPHLLSDPGDTLASLADHDAHRGDFVPVGKSRGKATILREGPRAEQATPYGATGPSRSNVDGLALVPSRTLGDLEETAFGLAADLAVLFCLGAAPSIHGPVQAENPPGRPALAANLDPVYQVFRQWNLDERRVNEWRMLVSGGAESEKHGDPAHRDPGMRPEPPGAAGPPYTSLAPDGEALATAMGWLPLWRAWFRMAADVTADSAAAVAMPYTPPVATRDGQRFQPTNARLTEAVRFLFDLA